MNSFALHPEAQADLEELADYIAERNIDAAHRVVNDIFAAFGMLSQFPQSGHRRPDLSARPLRFLRVRDYLIAYAPDENPIWILGVLHGRRHPSLMASILRGREQT